MIWKLALIKLNPFGLTNINDKNNFNLQPTFLPDIQGLIPNVNYKGENEKKKNDRLPFSQTNGTFYKSLVYLVLGSRINTVSLGK